MTEDAESYTQAEIVRLLTRLDTNINALSDDVKRLEQNYVTRAEWSLWKEGNDREMKQSKERHERDVLAVQGSLAEHEAKSAPAKVSGWMIGGIIISAVVGLGSLLGIAITLITVIK